MFVMRCAIVALLSLFPFFLVFWPMVRTWSKLYGLCHCPYTEAHIKRFGSPYLHVYACLLLCFMLVLASLVLGFAMFDALNGFVVMWLHPTLVRHCLDVTIWDALPWCWLLRAYLSRFPLCAMICLPCLFTPPFGFLCIFTCLLKLSMHESCWLVCCSHFNTMKLWKFDPNLHFSLTDTTFCLLYCLFAFSLVCLLSWFFACHVYHA